jgi:chromatin segregation and condensation protein Rec8/ScpA/Scc1 (kleisin family)
LSTGTITKETVTEEVDEEDDEVMFEMEKGPRIRLPSQTPVTKPKYRSRWMRRQQTTTMATQTTATDPEKLAIKMESLNLEAIAKKRETDLQAEILSGSLRQERLKKQLQECSRNRRQASATATNVDGGRSCRGATASRRSAEADEDNTNDWQAELLHDVDEETFK